MTIFSLRTQDSKGHFFLLLLLLLFFTQIYSNLPKFSQILYSFLYLKLSDHSQIIFPVFQPPPHSAPNSILGGHYVQIQSRIKNIFFLSVLFQKFLDHNQITFQSSDPPPHCALNLILGRHFGKIYSNSLYYHTNGYRCRQITINLFAEKRN